MKSVTELAVEHHHLRAERKPDEATLDRIIHLERLIAETRSETTEEIGLKEKTAAKIGHDDPFAIAILKSGIRDALRLAKAA